jgi:tRNA/rRNA methyltransferase
MDLHFILVQPAVPENVGASARALKTMGFSNLRLVNTNAHRDERSRWLAHGSADVLNLARHFDTFDQAIMDLDFVIGTTAKRRSVKNDYHSPEFLVEVIRQKGASIGQVGIVFGSEESGLSNEDLRKCDMASTIPLLNPYPSLNLAQCVMLYAYVLRDLARIPGHKLAVKSAKDYPLLKDRVVNLLTEVGIPAGTNLYHRVLERVAVAGEHDLHLMLSVHKKISEKLTNT